MIGACQLGAAYYGTVFDFAFVLGVARALLIAPLLGAVAAVLIEIPVVLLVSWRVAAWLLRGRGLGSGQRFLMGAIALGLTMASEVALAGLLRNQTPAQWATSVLTPLGLLGLSGQIAFALVPIFAGRRP